MNKYFFFIVECNLEFYENDCKNFCDFFYGVKCILMCKCLKEECDLIIIYDCRKYYVEVILFEIMFDYNL